MSDGSNNGETAPYQNFWLNSDNDKDYDGFRECKNSFQTTTHIFVVGTFLPSDACAKINEFFLDKSNRN